MNILVVEDEIGVAKSMLDFLKNEGGYRCTLARSVHEARDRLTTEIDLVILDWTLPDGSGLDLLKDWRQRGVSVPVVFLTARADLIDKVLGLEVGANDYITKPFAPRELLARMRVQQRIVAENAGGVAKEFEEEILSRSGIEMNSSSRRVSYLGRTIDLVHMEFELLRLFLENPGKVFTRHELLDLVWGYDHYPTTRTVDYHIAQLRQKLAPALFETVRRVGYRLVSGSKK